ncbi:hypothetical protein DKX38_017781 [Salix brachista]|uniref:Uncharacterized protein n=1 Tax=Salix brachista TaxID=2182728 RepID=A0A5N5KW48_9ROSI|nr:hypothetical protein DKX38_017781 [Salix brachista]
MSAAATKAWIVAASIGAVEALKDQDPQLYLSSSFSLSQWGLPSQYEHLMKNQSFCYEDVTSKMLNMVSVSDSGDLFETGFKGVGLI